MHFEQLTKTLKIQVQMLSAQKILQTVNANYALQLAEKCSSGRVLGKKDTEIEG